MIPTLIVVVHPIYLVFSNLDININRVYYFLLLINFVYVNISCFERKLKIDTISGFETSKFTNMISHFQYCIYNGISSVEKVVEKWLYIPLLRDLLYIEKNGCRR